MSSNGPSAPITPSAEELARYRRRSLASPQEQERLADLVGLLPRRGGSLLDVGAYDARLSSRLTHRFDLVVALDLEEPEAGLSEVLFVRGDARALPFESRRFDMVVCTEVLEHLPPETLRAVCDELCRVAAGPLLIGVPYKQDLRVGRSTCRACGATNPPWDHRSAFDRDRVERLFPTMTVREVSYVGRTFERTNPLSTWLMDLAGNPYGAFGPRSTCLACGAPLSRRPPRSFLQRVYTKLAVWANRAQRPFIAARPGWIHVLFVRRPRNHRVDVGF